MKKFLVFFLCLLYLFSHGIAFADPVPADDALEEQLRYIAETWMGVIVSEKQCFTETTVKDEQGNTLDVEAYSCQDKDETTGQEYLLFAKIQENKTSLLKIHLTHQRIDPETGDTTAIDAETAARLFLRICEQNEAFGNRGDMTHEQFLKECDCELFSPEQMRYADQSAWTSVLKVNGTEGSTIVELLWDASTMSIERVMLMTESPDSFAFIHLMR